MCVDSIRRALMLKPAQKLVRHVGILYQRNEINTALLQSSLNCRQFIGLRHLKIPNARGDSSAALVLTTLNLYQPISGKSGRNVCND